jgi:hypothetical protein
VENSPEERGTGIRRVPVPPVDRSSDLVIRRLDPSGGGRLVTALFAVEEKVSVHRAGAQVVLVEVAAAAEARIQVEADATDRD